MTEQDVRKKVKEIICNKLGINETEVKDTSRLQYDFGKHSADSLEIVELNMDFDKEFNIRISDEEAEKISTVGDLIRLICNKKHIPCTGSQKPTNTKPIQQPDITMRVSHASISFYQGNTIISINNPRLAPVKAAIDNALSKINSGR